MAHTEYTSVLAKAIYDKLVLNQTALALADVLYGNHNDIPRSPTVVVIPGLKTRQLVGVQGPGGRVENDLIVYIDIHDSKVKDETTQRLVLDKKAEEVEKKIHEDVTMGGLIIHGFVHSWDPGQAFFQSGEFRSVRLTYSGRSRTLLSV